MKPSAKHTRTAGRRHGAGTPARTVKDFAPKKNLKSGRTDPTGNTIYVGTANGGVWKTT
jgi:hypothetical protein